MPDASSRVEMAGGVPVVRAPEEIDITNADGLREAMAEAGTRGNETFVVDMTGTRFCDSSGLQALLRAYERARDQGGRVILAIPGPHVLRILAITGIDRVIPTVGRLDEALAQIGTANAADEVAGT
jgi:anti-sigma B factor antagonist